MSARDQRAGDGVAARWGLHVHHEAVKGKTGMCSNTLRWNGYRHDHASGGDMVIQPDQEKTPPR